LSTTELQVGFLAVVEEGGGFQGGYLVTNAWGRPLEFRFTSPVRPTRVQQALYGKTLRPYMCGEIIGKAIVQKAAAQPELILTDCQWMRDLRAEFSCPLIWLTQPDPIEPPNREELVARSADMVLLAHSRYTADVSIVQAVLARLAIIDLAEPFGRIREALAEVRQQGLLRAA
jgi:hypothetical protein